jgi:hypothetical protein
MLFYCICNTKSQINSLEEEEEVSLDAVPQDKFPEIFVRAQPKTSWLP